MSKKISEKVEGAKQRGQHIIQKLNSFANFLYVVRMTQIQKDKKERIYIKLYSININQEIVNQIKNKANRSHKCNTHKHTSPINSVKL